MPIRNSLIPSKIIKEKAPVIIAEVKKANSILLHLHPSPDPDSVGSALAMKFALVSLGKKATVIKGDSVFPQAFGHFPGAPDILAKNFLEIDPNEYDLFIVLDSGNVEMISRRGNIEFPDSMKVIVIDHHRTNPNYGSINLVEPNYPSTCQVLFDLFKEWDIEISKEIADNLFMGIFSDTGGFKYAGTDSHTFEIASELAKISNDFPKMIATMENSNTPAILKFRSLALSRIEVFEKVCAVSSISYEDIKSLNISADEMQSSEISSIMRTVAEWGIAVALIEREPNTIKGSIRTGNADKYDVSKLAVALGGGGHRAAAGVNLSMSLEQAKKAVVREVKRIYNI